jgi:hypothetical protein
VPFSPRLRIENPALQTVRQGRLHHYRRAQEYPEALYRHAPTAMAGRTLGPIEEHLAAGPLRPGIRGGVRANGKSGINVTPRVHEAQVHRRARHGCYRAITKVLRPKDQCKASGVEKS